MWPSRDARSRDADVYFPQRLADAPSVGVEQHDGDRVHLQLLPVAGDVRDPRQPKMRLRRGEDVVTVQVRLVRALRVALTHQVAVTDRLQRLPRMDRCPV